MSFTFSEIVSALWPEIDYFIQQKLKEHKGDLKDIFKNIEAKHKDAKDNLTPIESGADLDWVSKNGSKNLLSLLQEWNEIHKQSISAPPVSLKDAAAICLNAFNPANYDEKILGHLLNLASQFDIDVKKVNPANWVNLPQILQDLVRQNAPIQSIQLAANLRERGGIRLTQEGTSYSISGVKNLDFLCMLLSFFPKTIELSLNNNEIRSLKPLMASLSSLSALRNLDLSENPIHDPSPLAGFSQLTQLNLTNTCVPAPVKDKLVISPSPTKQEPPFFTGQTYINNPTNVYLNKEILLSLDGPDTFLKLLAAVIATHTNGQVKRNFNCDIDAQICILEKLAENFWNETLSYGDINVEKIPDYFNKLFKILQPPYEPRPSAFRLVFALTYGLPSGTVPGSLVFQAGFTNEAKDLTRLEISNFQVSPIHLASLQQFTSLTHLSLCAIGLKNLNDLPSLPLQVLKLPGNLITSLQGLHTSEQHRKFPNLQVMVLTNNQLTTNKKACLDLLSELPLVWLDLNDNLLEEIPNLGNIRTLKHLDLRDNKIKKGLPKNTEFFLYMPQKNEN